MRTLLLLRGCPASGKSTWVKENNLEPYTLSADKIRLSKRSPILNKSGNLCISQSFDNEVWTQLFETLEERMQRGEFVVIDATHYRSELIQRYKKLVDEYRYRAYIIDFTGVSKEECLRRNELRPEFQRVPNEVIEKMCAVFDAEKDGVFKEVSNKYKILQPENAMQELQDNILFDLNDVYDKVVIFGDIHGCYEPLKKYFDKNPINEKTEYIFTGDYIDRGIQNKEVLDFISNHRQDKNFLFLEGNHEIWLRKYCSKTYNPFNPSDEEKKILRKYCGKGFIQQEYNKNIRSNEFLNNTVPQIENINKGELRQICRKLSQFSYFKLGDKKYMVCHGGVPCVPNLFVSTDEFIKGVGKYEDVEEIYNSWHKNTDENTFLIHGHRNIFKLPIVNNRCINLCDEPELGENLRAIEIDKNGILNEIYIKNDVYNKECQKVAERFTVLPSNSSNDILNNLNNSKWVQKKLLDDNIISYNFTRDAFYKGHWNDITCKARGLFVDKESEKVVARSYDKFFNWGQTEESSSMSLKHSLKFPVYAYRKENGFLGLISYDFKNNNLKFFSKSTDKGDFAQWVKDTFYELYGNVENDVKNYLKTNNCTMIFECVRPVEDPHIIKYDSNKLILLDVVQNSFGTNFISYEEVVKLAELYNLEYKKLEYTFNDFETLHNFKKEVSEKWNCKHEGYVFVDCNGFMVKVKSRFYTWWKQFRAIKDKMANNQNIKKVYTNEFDVKLYQLLMEYKPEELKELSIIDIQDEFYRKVDI